MVKKIAIIFLLGIVVISTGCGSSNKSVFEALTDLDQRVQQMDNRLQDYHSEVNALNDRVTIVEQRTTLTENENAKLKGRVEVLEKKSIQPEPKISEKETEFANAAKSSISMEPLHPESAKQKEAYKIARNIHESKQYHEAIQKFKEIITSFPRTELTDNCYYWIGEGYYQLHDYEKALDAFNAVLSINGTNKEKDARKMRKQCYIRLGRPEKNPLAIN